MREGVTPPGQQITGVHSAPTADGFEVWGLSFISATFVVVSLCVMIKGNVHVGQPNGGGMKVCASLSSVYHF